MWFVQQARKKEEEEGKLEQKRKGTPYRDHELLKPSLESTKLTVIIRN